MRSSPPDCKSCYFCSDSGECDHTLLFNDYIEGLCSLSDVPELNVIPHPANYGVKIEDIEECGFHTIDNPFIQASPVPEVCEWCLSDDDNNLWISKCNDSEFGITEGTPIENGMLFCHKCGKKLKEVEEWD